MFLVRATTSRLSTIFATPAVASAHAPAGILRSSNDSTREHPSRVRFTRDVEVKEFPRAANVKCGDGYDDRGCGLDYYHCKCLRKQRYNGQMKATFVVYESQIPSVLPAPPSLASRITNFISSSIMADALLTTARTEIDVPSEIVDTATSDNGTVQRRSKRTRNRQPQIGNEAEEPEVEFEAVDEPIITESDASNDAEPIGDEAEEIVVDEVVAEEAVAASRPRTSRILKELESPLDGVYWSTDGPRNRRKPTRFSPAM
jgi:hypothetical protein